MEQPWLHWIEVINYGKQKCYKLAHIVPPTASKATCWLQVLEFTTVEKEAGQVQVEDICTCHVNVDRNPG